MKNENKCDETQNSKKFQWKGADENIIMHVYTIYIKHVQHTGHVSDGDRRSLHFLHLGVNADLVLAAGSEIVEALSGSTTSQAHFLLLTICK